MALVADPSSILSANGGLPVTIRPFLTSGSPNIPTGDAHKRHRRAIAPAFGLVETRGLVPYFMDVAAKVREIYRYSLLNLVLDISPRHW